jgi:hypothetical protein
MFDNSIEPAARPIAARKPERKDDWDEMPIREATRAETQKLKSNPGPHAGETDAVAKRHNLYTADKWSSRVYYADYQQKSEVMRANSNRITTKLDDRQTVSAMLDLAQARGWQSINLRGTESFKREAWVQAQVRGIATEGYQPKTTDMQEAERRKVAATPVAQPAKAPAEASAASTTKPAPAKTGKPVQASTVKPPAAEASQTAQQRQAAVWGTVEAAGQQARQNDTATLKPAQKPAEKPAAAAA